MMNRGENSDPIPIDLILKILSRSSAKSVARFRLASKFCASILLSRPDFTELFLARSSAQPRLFFALQRDRKWHFYSSPRPQNPDERPSLVVVASDTHMESPGDTMCSELCGPVSGLIYFPNMRKSKGDMITVPVIYNPSTGQYTCLPKPMTKKKGLEKSFLGYDPIDKRFKVLFSCEGEHQILTLGTGKVSWRTIKMPLTNYPLGEGICINGILYYLAPKPVVIGCQPRANIVCIDVRSEKVRFLEGKAINEIFWPTKLINYKGKLGGVSTQWYGNSDGGYGIGLSLWVLEDAKKQEWSTRYFYLRHGIECKVSVPLVVVGATATCDIIFSMNYTSKPFYVLYINPERNTFKSFEIGGFEAFENRCKVCTFVDHVDDLKFLT